MKEKIEGFLELKENLTSELKIWVKNKDIPLNERWEVFINSGLGKHQKNYWDFTTFDSDDFHDGDMREKYQTFDVNDVISWVEDDYKKEPATEVEINAFKVEALSNFIFSWEFNW